MRVQQHFQNVCYLEIHDTHIYADAVACHVVKDKIESSKHPRLYLDYDIYWEPCYSFVCFQSAMEHGGIPAAVQSLSFPAV